MTFTSSLASDHRQAAIDQATAYLKAAGCQPDVVVVLGSGLGDFERQLPLKDKGSLAYEAIEGFPKRPQGAPEGHRGELVWGQLTNGQTVALMVGRYHYYEGFSPAEVVRPIQALSQCGAKTLVVTNAAGGVNPSFQPGDLMLIRDHLNLTGTHPLLGPNLGSLGSRFFDMSTAYDPTLSEKLLDIAKQQGLQLKEGVYAGLSGPSYETPAEVRMLQTLGADAVGMSTVLEVLAARHAGLQVLGLSCITNAAAGLGNSELNHQEVLDVGRQAAGQLKTLLQTFLEA